MLTSQKISQLTETILTQAFADAFGYLIEFDNLESIKLKYGKLLDLPTLRQNKINIYLSDDTQMNLFALEGLISCIHGGSFQYHQKQITQSYVNWLSTQKHTSHIKTSYLLSQKFLYSQRAPGNTCLSALEKIDTEKLKLTYDTKNTVNLSKGCGGIMRTLPFGFFANSPQEAFDFGADQAAITHGDSNGYLSAGFYSLMIYFLLNDNPNASPSKNSTPISDYNNSIYSAYLKSKHFISTKSLLPYFQNLDNILEEFFQSSNKLSSTQITKRLGEGWTGDSALIFSIYCAIVSNSIEECLNISSNHNGDSDSTAMLTIGLFKTAYPHEKLPLITDWLLMPEYDNVVTVLNFFSSKLSSIYQSDAETETKLLLGREDIYKLNDQINSINTNSHSHSNSSFPKQKNNPH